MAPPFAISFKARIWSRYPSGATAIERVEFGEQEWREEEARGKRAEAWWRGRPGWREGWSWVGRGREWKRVRERRWATSGGENVWEKEEEEGGRGWRGRRREGGREGYWWLWLWFWCWVSFLLPLLLLLLLLLLLVLLLVLLLLLSCGSTGTMRHCSPPPFLPPFVCACRKAAWREERTVSR